jgi:uncharacterized protein DUF4126
MFDVPPELLALPPLGLAAGIDLYLTLLLIGAAPTTGLWDLPLPGALGDLDSPGVLILVGSFYLLEFAAERFPPAALAWNAFHAIIRPLSGMLLALLLLDGQSLPVMIGGSLLGGLLASLAHGIRSGSAAVRWLGATSPPSVLLVSIAEDMLVLGIVSLTLDAPAWAFVASLALLLAIGYAVPSLLRAFGFAIRLAIGRIFQALTRRRWHAAGDLPVWVRSSLEEDDVLSPTGALRGSPVGALRLPGAPRFALGWLVVRGGAPFFVFRRWRKARRIDLGPLTAEQILEGDFFRRIDLRLVDSGRGGDAPAYVFFSLNGPSSESLQADFPTE